MAKEYTDYILMTLGSGERVYDTVHLRYHKGKLYNPDMVDFKKALPFGVGFIAQPLNGHKYLLNLDRAYRINWAPWKKLVVKKPYWKNFYKPLIELTRSKKVGLLFYQEPGEEPLIEVPIIIDCECSCGFKGKNKTGTKVHVKAKGEGHILKNITEIHYELPAKKPVEPMHISRIHQPSGEMKG